MIYDYAPGSAAAHERSMGLVSEPPTPAYVVLRPAQPYDLATPGTPQGILAVAKAADAGPGGWRYAATLALAAEAVSGAVVASLALRLACDVPPSPLKSSHQCRRCARWLEGEWSQADAAGRVELQRQMDAGRCDACAARESKQRRAWVMYVRRTTERGSSWTATAPGGLGGAALLDPLDATRPLRPIGIEELKALLRGEPWTPPAPRQTFTVPCPVCGQPAKLTAAGKIYSSHRCGTKHAEGRS